MRNSEQNPQSYQTDIRGSASNGFRPNVYISDELEDLKRRCTSEQLQKIQKMWEDAYPKSSEIKSEVIFITGTSKQ